MTPVDGPAAPDMPESAPQMALSGANAPSAGAVDPPVLAPVEPVVPAADPEPVPARPVKRSRPAAAPAPAEVPTKVVCLVSGAIFIPGRSTPALVVGVEYELDKLIAPGLTLADVTRPEWFSPVSPAEE